MSSVRDLEVSGRFPALQLRRSKAPKGGGFSQIAPHDLNQNQLTFNSLNSYILRGDAAAGMELTFATLMREPTMSPTDVRPRRARSHLRRRVTYRFCLRPDARFMTARGSRPMTSCFFADGA